MKILRNYNLSYVDLIKMFKARMVTHEDLAFKLGKPDSERLISIRHDVDVSLEAALRLAKHEKEQNIKSTYFLLHTADYFDYSNKFKKQCHKILEYGHNIGIHNNAVIMSKITGQSQFEILMKPLKFLRSCNIEVLGSAPHGIKLDAESIIFPVFITKFYGRNINHMILICYIMHTNFIERDLSETAVVF